MTTWPFLELLQLTTLTLATTGSTGQPHAAAVYFAAGDDLRLYFFSEGKSQHSQDLARDPRAAAAIYPECRGWQEIRGLQLRGHARPLEPGADREQAWELYRTKFPFALTFEPVIARSLLYAFTPDWIRLVDNRRRFGFKQEWTFP